MTRMIDRIRRNGFSCTEGPNGNIGQDTRRYLREATIVDATNVMRYWASPHGSTQGGQMLKAGDVSAAAPPFDVFWVEYPWPYRRLAENAYLRTHFDHLLDGGEALTEAEVKVAEAAFPQARHVGCLFRYVELADEEMRDYYRGMVSWEMASDVRWVMMISLMLEWEKGAPIDGPKVIFTLDVSESGEVAQRSGTRSGQLPLGGTIIYDPAIHPFFDDPENETGMLQMMGIYVCPALLALSFMHCKNVSLSPVEAAPKVQKKAIKNYGVPLTKYHTLVIDPSFAGKNPERDEVGSREPSGASAGVLKAYHIARGHIRTYTEERPLFGKYAGRFFIPQHVRGSRAKGRIIKDYQVGKDPQN